MPALEEVAVAGPFAVLYRHLVVAILSMERDVQTVNLHAVTFAGVDSRLFDFTNQARLHRFSLHARFRSGI
jgi:hypothetical protein